jgi:hypothetical protein
MPMSKLRIKNYELNLNTTISIPAAFGFTTSKEIFFSFIKLFFRRIKKLQGLCL